ncbi:carbohydrate ABC transporter permease [Treponema parvum]|uniref:Carbohydrate ABC transporter permease n=1 Tax=Treponema parvum TaxID=138851 RepID=A0A975IGK5_9SPIR|nr:carbohydrate ABC transporter permease [Treponema parvum]
MKMNNYRVEKRMKIFLFYLLMLLICTVVIFPLYFVLISSFKNMADVYMMPPKLLGFKPIFDHYKYIFKSQHYGTYIFNSGFIGILSTLFSLLLGIPAAYAIAREKMKGAALFILIARLLPAMSFLLPYYFVFSKLKLIDTFCPLILSHMVLSLPLVVWLMEEFIAGIPVDLDEAAIIDGCSRAKCCWSIIVPISKSGIATCTILSFLGSWNNFQFALVLSGTRTRTLPVTLQYFVSGADIRWGRMLSATIVVILPAIIITLILQKYIIQGMTAGAVKG